MKSIFGIFLLSLISLIFYFIKFQNELKKECEEPKSLSVVLILLHKWNKNDNLRSMKRVFTHLNYKITNISTPWDVMWSVEFPFDRFRDKIEGLQMQPHMKINHFPGAPFYTNKLSMITTTNSKYVPRGFEFPKQLEEFNRFTSKNPDKIFVVKNYDNRGVKIVSKDFAKLLAKSEKNQRFLQEFINNPLLIDGHAFDIGVYVLITSIEPLRIYRYKRENLFRFCPEPYHPFNHENPRQYVVRDDHKSFWSMKAFEESVKKFNFSQTEAFKHHLRLNGFEPFELWDQFDEAIIDVIQSQHQRIVAEINYECEIFNCTNNNFFELVRFDFVVDENLKPHVMEVNMSPNLTPVLEKFERNAVQYEQVIYNTLQVVGALSFSDLRHQNQLSSPQDISVNIQTCAECNLTCSPPECALCFNCLSDDDKNMFHRAFLEHNRKGEFERIFPTILEMEDEKFMRMSEKTQKLAEWYEGKCRRNEEWC